MFRTRPDVALARAITDLCGEYRSTRDSREYVCEGLFDRWGLVLLAASVAINGIYHVIPLPTSHGVSAQVSTDNIGNDVDPAVLNTMTITIIDTATDDHRGIRVQFDQEVNGATVQASDSSVSLDGSD